MPLFVDRKIGLVTVPAKFKAINHDGRFFKVEGPLRVLPSPQIKIRGQKRSQ
jgi:hypothetical protein